MSERIDIVTRIGHYAEFFPEVPLAVKPLPRERFSGRGVAVRLEPPAACNPPFFGCYRFAYPLKQL